MNISFGFSENKNPLQAANEATRQAIIGLDTYHADLALIFTSAEFAQEAILKIINNLLGEIPITGCSSLGIITNKGIFRYGLAIILINLSPQMFFNIASVKDISQKNPLDCGRELGDKLLYGCKDVNRDLSIIFSDGLIADATSLINGIQESLGRSFPLLGASASDNFTFSKTFQYYNHEVLSDSCCGLLLGGKMNFGFGIKHGWQPLGKIRQITKSYGNIIEEIDGQPAVKLYEDYLAKDLLALTKELQRISIYYPIGVYLQGEKEYLLRNVKSIKNDGSLVTQGDVPQDSKIRLMISTKESCLAAATAACQEAKNNLRTQKAKLVMIFDSASRFSLLGKQHQKELEIIKSTFGENTPLVGIYTYGEQAPLKAINYLGRAYFHNQSINVLAIGEQ